MTSSRGGKRRRRPILVPAAIAIAAAGLGVTALLGGLQEAPEKPPPEVAPGKIIDQGRFSTQFIKAIDTTEQDRYGTPKRSLQLVLKVKNVSNETAPVGGIPKPDAKPSMGFGEFASSLLRIAPEIKSEYGPSVYVLSYGVQSRQLHPGITTTVVVKYDLKPTDPAPSEITIDVGSFVYEEIGLRDKTRQWRLAGELDDEEFTPTVAARITLPVRQEQGQ